MLTVGLPWQRDDDCDAPRNQKVPCDSEQVLCSDDCLDNEIHDQIVIEERMKSNGAHNLCVSLVSVHDVDVGMNVASNHRTWYPKQSGKRVTIFNLCVSPHVHV